MPAEPMATPHALPRLPRLTTDEEQELAARRVAGDGAARERLILHNIDLAAGMARGFRGGTFARHFDDLLSVAVSGLIEAVDRYEPGRVSQGRVVRFGTYAGRIITQRLHASVVNEIQMIRVPEQTAYFMGCLERGVSPGPRPIDGYRELAEAGRRVARCQAVGTAGMARCEDPFYFVPTSGDDEGEGPREDANPRLGLALARLARDHEKLHGVIVRHYGRGGEGGQAFVAIARELGCSRELVRKRHDRGIAKLRIYLGEMGVTA